jgi:hypothetical protein
MAVSDKHFTKAIVNKVNASFSVRGINREVKNYESSWKAKTINNLWFHAGVSSKVLSF